MKRDRRILLAGLALAAAGWFAFAGGHADACSQAPQAKLETAPLTLETVRGVHAFTVELARTPEETACGLMRRPRLSREEGMLFLRDPPGPAHFWMKDTPQPLDMLFLDEGGRVIHLAEFTTPYSTGVYGTDAKVAGVLEVKAGTVARLAVQTGDVVRHPWFRRK